MLPHNKTFTLDLRKQRLKVKGENIYIYIYIYVYIYTYHQWKPQASRRLIISDNIDFKLNIAREDKGHYIIKEFIYQKYITINVYAPNIRTPKQMKQALREFKGKNDKSTTIKGDFNNHFE